MTAWLITGGAGFIGANFVRLAAAGAADTLVVLDALTYAGNLTNIADVVDDRRVPIPQRRHLRCCTRR